MIACFFIIELFSLWIGACEDDDLHVVYSVLNEQKWYRETLSDQRLLMMSRLVWIVKPSQIDGCESLTF